MTHQVEIYDTHAHINYPDFKNRMGEVLSSCSDLGVGRVIAIATDLESSKEVIELAHEYDPVYAVVGWHPSDCLNAPDDIREELLYLAKQPKVVAIGETGLDYYRLPSQCDDSKTEDDDVFYKNKQASLFEQQIEVAEKVGLNLVIHQREAFDDTMKFMTPLKGKRRGVFHCFVGTPEQQKMVQSIGSMVSFTGIVTFKNAESVRETVRATPIDQLMVETDCPYLAPVPYRGKRCEPSYVRYVAERVAQEKNISLNELAEITSNNAKEFFIGLK